MGEARQRTGMHVVPVEADTAEEWMKLWNRATSLDKPDKETERLLLQFRALIRSPTSNTYLCVQQDGTVCINGKQKDLNSVFTVIHLFKVGFYQIICDGGQCKNYILYVKDGHLQSRVYHSDKDSVDDPNRLPKETLFLMEQNATKREACLKSNMGPYTLVYTTTEGDENYTVSLDRETDGPTEDRLLFKVSFARKETTV